MVVVTFGLEVQLDETLEKTGGSWPKASLQA